MQRRLFLRSSGIFAAGMYASTARAIAGPFLPGEITHNIPVDKKLDPSWVKSLSKRGFATKYYQSKNELKYTGMPVGGIYTGTVYLGGDGKLWLWDIFNANQNGIDPKTIEWTLNKTIKINAQNGAGYVQPSLQIRPLEQGFAFKITIGNNTFIKKMDANDWDDIVFEASYPMAKIHYIDHQVPVDITATVYSPFIALDDRNSGLPCTIYSFQIKNKSTQPISISILGWLENKVSIKSAVATDIRINKIVETQTGKALQCSINNNGNAEQLLAPDYGTMAITAMSEKAQYQTNCNFPITSDSFNQVNNQPTEKKASTQLMGAVEVAYQLKPDQTIESNFSIAWHFNNLHFNKLAADKGRYYNNWYKSAAEVTQYVTKHFLKLSQESNLWKQTWYDSSLPYWFLERTFLNISILATTTAHRFESGRFYGWEGVGCCEGTCTHVWQYAHAMGRIFPAVEKDTREKIDLGVSLQPDGMIWYRGEHGQSAAIDGQAGTILRIYREHQMSANYLFLQQNWDKIKKAVQWVMNQDKNKDGMEDTPLENTLDAVWDGEIAWLVGLCIAAVKAGELMAIEMNDVAFANTCANYVTMGSKNMEDQLFNGEYFIHKPDTIKGRAKLGSYNTCHIDQLYGQSWAHQVGIGRLVDKTKTLSALKALWKYNFTPDVGPYIKAREGGRPYVLPGEGGLVMNTNPKNDPKPYGENVTWQMGYFNECMTGFEHQVAAHMMAEGMVDESLVITRMIHDRYHAAKRNPFNEIECSDHYSRAMASYGSFITACGFQYHGPKGYLGFAPMIGAENFKAPFTSAKGWGTFMQKKDAHHLLATVHIKYGSLQLQSFSLVPTHTVLKISVTIDGKNIPASFTQENNTCLIQFKEPIQLSVTQTLQISI